MLISLLKIRWLQATRELQSIGLFRVLILLAVLILIMMAAMHVGQKLPYGWILPAITAVATWYIQSNRADHRFLNIHAPYPVITRCVEYLIASMPIIIVLLMGENGWLAFSIPPLLWFISRLTPSYSTITRHQKIIGLIPAQRYEWRSGIRQTFWWMLFLHISMLAFAFQPAVLAVIILLYTFAILSFHDTCEPRNFIEQWNGTAATYLASQIKQNIIIFSISLLPALLLCLLFQGKLIWLPLWVMLNSFVIIAFSIYLKYSMYQPNSRLYANQIIYFIIIFSYLLPFLTPVILLFGVYYRRSAIQQLKPLLDDRNP